MKIFKWVAMVVPAALILGITWLTIAPPALIRVGANYTAKIVCSNVFTAGRDPQEVLAVDVQAPGHPLLTVMQVAVDEKASQVKAGLLGFIGGGAAVHRPGHGCTTVANGELESVVPLQSLGGATSDSPLEKALDPKVMQILDDVELIGPNMRAIVVLRGGKIVAEKYGKGFSVDTPLLGWSMAKTVTAALIGTLVKDNTLTLGDANLFDEWANDDRQNITLSDLLGMASGLNWNERYGSVTDVTQMLFLESNMAAFAKKRPLSSEIGKTFNYSSGTSVLISRYLQDRLQGRATSAPRTKLFEPLGMRSAHFETDASGTMVGGSFLYATPRDWARFGQFLLQGGKWNGEQLLPENYVKWMTQAHPASNGQYGQGHVWLRAPGERDNERRLPFPEDGFWLAGHDGQSIAVVPSEGLVVVRMGLTPSSFGYRASTLTSAIIEVLN